MTPLRNHHVPEFAHASRPFASRPVTTVEAFKAVIAWLRGRRPSLAERIREQQVVDAIAAEIAESE
jgi:hypothetical protein